MNVKEIVTPYQKAIEMNKKLGLTPSLKRYSVVGLGFYGLYEEYDKMILNLKDMGYKRSEMKNLIHQEPKNNTYKAYNDVFLRFYKIDGNEYYEPVPITRDNINTIIHLNKVKAFTHI